MWKYDVMCSVSNCCGYGNTNSYSSRLHNKKNRLEIDKKNGQAHTHRPTVCVLVCYFIYSQSQVFHYGVNSPARLYIFTFIFKAQANVLKC